MLKILKYSFYDLSRSRWSYVYFLFYLMLGFVLLFLNNDLSGAIITLMNVIIILIPLIGTIFGVMYYYNSKEFTELLLAQPVKRIHIFFWVNTWAWLYRYRQVCFSVWEFLLLHTDFFSRRYFHIS